MKKHRTLICCIVLFAFALTLLPGDVWGKYVKLFEDIGTILVPKNYYTVTIVDNYVERFSTPVLISEDCNLNDFLTYNEKLDNQEFVDYLDGKVPEAWVYAGGGTVDSNKEDNTIDHIIPAGHTTDVVIYPKWADEYWLRFLDGLGNDEENVILAYNISTTEGKNKFTTDRDSGVFDSILKNSVTIDNVEYDSVQSRWDAKYDPAIEPYIVSGWNPAISSLSVDDPTADIIVTAVGAPAEYEGNLTFTGNDSDGDGVPETFSVSGVSADDIGLAEIPEYYQGQKVTNIAPGTFAGFDNIHAVTIPDSVESIGANAFVSSESSRQTITIYFEGTKETWAQYMEDYNNRNSIPEEDRCLKNSWDSQLGPGSRVFFLDENGKVITNGYWQLCNHKHVYGDVWYENWSNFRWEYHDHEYGSNDGCSLHHCQQTDYLANCATDCAICAGGPRPDQKYWTDVVAANEEETP